MDPVTHTMVGAALSEAGGRRATPLAMTTLILAANAPDVDIVAQFGGPYVGLALRRGITHGLPALVVLPFVVLGVVAGLDRLLRRGRPDRTPFRPGATLALAFLGVLTHPFLDWLNTYGMRWLMPIDGRWFYGDALFIIDPWLWLGLGGTLFLVHSGRVSKVLAWAALAAAMSFLVLFQPIVPAPGKALWAAGLLGFTALRVLRGVERERMARVALAGATLYILAMVASSVAAEREVRDALAASGVPEVGDVMVGPEPANPFAGSIVAASPGAYHLGTFHWLRSPRATFDRIIPYTREHVPGEPAMDAAVEDAVQAAIGTGSARNFLAWSRFPFYEVRETAEGFSVLIGDARYAGRMGAGALGGLTVHLDRDLRPR
jgi:inner membrane protein